MRFNIRHEIICFSERYGANEPNKMIMSAYLVKTYTLKICICNETITKLFTTFLCFTFVTKGVYSYTFKKQWLQ